MTCLLCGSDNEAEFTAEVNVHFRGLKKRDKPSVFVFPKLLICLDCGLSRFATPKTELALLARGAATSEASTRGSVSTTAHSVSELLHRAGVDL
jgi:hypothetical protein